MSDGMITLRSDCSWAEECARIDRRREGWLAVTGYLLDADGTRLPGEPEGTVEAPDRLLPELVDLNLADLTGFIEAHHRTDLLRIQTLDRYNTASDGDMFDRYLAGQPFRTQPGQDAWGEKLRAAAAAGRRRRNLHVVREPLTDYLRYQFEWGYTFNASAGMDIRILAVEDGPVAAQLFFVGDFAVIERREVIRYQYADGTFVGATQASSDAAVFAAALAEMAWSAATPFAAWWADHGQYHRATRAA